MRRGDLAAKSVSATLREASSLASLTRWSKLPSAIPTSSSFASRNSVTEVGAAASVLDGWMDGWTDGWMDGWMDG